MTIVALAVAYVSFHGLSLVANGLAACMLPHCLWTLSLVGKASCPSWSPATWRGSVPRTCQACLLRALLLPCQGTSPERVTAGKRAAIQRSPRRTLRGVESDFRPHRSPPSDTLPQPPLAHSGKQSGRRVPGLHRATEAAPRSAEHCTAGRGAHYLGECSPCLLFALS